MMKRGYAHVVIKSCMAKIEPGIYRHFKGKMYRVIGMVTHSETLEELVLYQALYGEMGFWVRPVAMFGEIVLHENQSVQRFTLIEKEREE